MSAALPGTRPDVDSTENTCRHCARRGERLFEWHADLEEVPHGLRHRQRAACQDAVLAPDDVVGDDDLGLSERVRAVAEPRARDRVGHERDPSSGDLPEEPNDVRVEVDSVHDRLDDDVRPNERGADDPGVPVRERAHRVEDMRHGAGAAVEGCVRLDCRRIAVPERDGDAACMKLVDQLERTRQLGRQGHEPDRAGFEQALEERDVRVTPSVQAVRPEPARRQERPLEMRPQDARSST